MINLSFIPSPKHDLNKNTGDNPHFKLLLASWEEIPDRKINLCIDHKQKKMDNLATLILWPDIFLEKCLNSIVFRVTLKMKRLVGNRAVARSLNWCVEKQLDYINGLNQPIFWQVHELMGHHVKDEFLEQDFRIRKCIADKALGIFATEESTVQLISDYFDIPKNKISVSNLGGYSDFYGQEIESSEAKRILGIPTEPTSILIFGRARKQKDISNLVKKLQEQGFFLILAGQGYNYGEYNPEKTLLLEKFIDMALVRHLFSASDYVLKPEQNYLNSGVVRMGISYAKPIIAAPYGSVIDMAKNCLIEMSTINGDYDWIESIVSRESQEYSIMRFSARKSDQVRTWSMAARAFDDEIANKLFSQDPR
jgi:hypothetical protein